MKTILITLGVLLMQPFVFAKSSALENAVHDSDLKAVKRLIAKGVDVNKQNKHEPSEVADGKSALMIASWNGDTEIVKALLDAGAKVNLKDSDGSGALYMAAVNGHADIVDLLLKAKADPKALGTGKTTILMYMAMHPAENNLERVIKSLIAAGLNVNAVDDEGNTALHHACNPSEDGQLVIARVLIKNGAKTSMKNKAGKTPAAVAKEQVDSKKMLKILKG